MRVMLFSNFQLLKTQSYNLYKQISVCECRMCKQRALGTLAPEAIWYLIVLWVVLTRHVWAGFGLPHSVWRAKKSWNILTERQSHNPSAVIHLKIKRPKYRTLTLFSKLNVVGWVVLTSWGSCGSGGRWLAVRSPPVCKILGNWWAVGFLHGS